MKADFHQPRTLPVYYHVFWEKASGFPAHRSQMLQACAVVLQVGFVVAGEQVVDCRKQCGAVGGEVAVQLDGV